MYQQTRLSDTSPIGAPGPLPDVIATWTDPDMLADLTGRVDPQFGFDRTGFWLVDVIVPGFDPTRQVLVPPTAVDTIDAKARRCTATATVRAMTAEEFAAANPPVPVSGDAIIGAISKTDAAKVDVRDLTRIAYRDDVPATNSKLARIAKALGTTPDALRAAATA